MDNARKELIRHIKNKKVEFVSIVDCSSTPTRLIEGKLEDVLPKLDFVYDSGYGEQELFGYIWYADGTWSERGEYDGSEWWECRVRPPIDIHYDMRENK